MGARSVPCKPLKSCFIALAKVNKENLALSKQTVYFVAVQHYSNQEKMLPGVDILIAFLEERLLDTQAPEPAVNLSHGTENTKIHSKRTSIVLKYCHLFIC